MDAAHGMPHENLIYIGVDDTDNLDSRGTGFLARSLSEALAADGLVAPREVTRHQLFVSPAIPYTSHNSSACLTVEPLATEEAILRLAEDFVRGRAAPGSDPGVAVAQVRQVSAAVLEFGLRAKREVLTMDLARETAAVAGIHLSGLGGTRQGIIGSLAAVALRHSGSDGRFLWLKGIREMKGTYSVADLLAKSGVIRLRPDGNGDGVDPAPTDTIDVGEWFRPVLLDGVPTLLIRLAGPDEASGHRRWQIEAKDAIKEY